MTRYLTDSFTTDSVSAGSSLDFERDLPNSFVDIFKIEITPSVVDSTSEFIIYSNSTRLAGERLYDSGAWAGAKFYDPVEDNDGVYAERNEGFVARYYDDTLAMKMFCRVTNNDSVAKTYDVVITYAISSFAASTVLAPADLVANSYARQLDLTSVVTATKNPDTVSVGEFRATFIEEGDPVPDSVDLRTAAEGGTFTHNGTTQLIITGIAANEEGAIYQWTSGAQGTWFYAWKLSGDGGASRWTDGNASPQYVTQFVLTAEAIDNGSPINWKVTVEKGAPDDTFIVRATRPIQYGNTIIHWLVQMKDVSTGSWIELDSASAPAEVKYDGSAASHEYDPVNLYFITPGNWGSAEVGDLVLVDVRGSGIAGYLIDYTQWLIVKAIDSTHLTVRGIFRPLLSAHKDGDIYDQIRLKIVKPPWKWTTGGYLGAMRNGGFWSPNGIDFNPAKFMNDLNSSEFQSDAIPVTPSLNTVEARVWFENAYGRSWNSRHSTGIIGGAGIFGEYSWTNLQERQWFVPIVSGTQVDFVPVIDGTYIMNVTGATGDNKYCYVGVCHRSRIVPDSSGIIKVQAGWTNVTFSDDGSHKAETSYVVLAYHVIGSVGTLSGAGYKGQYGIMARSTYSAGRKLEISIVRYQDGNTAPLFDSNYDSVITMPDTPFTINLRLTLQETGNVFCLSIAEYQIDGGSWVELDLSTPPFYHPGGVIGGMKFSAVMGETNRMNGDSCTLSSFTVENGIVVGDAN